MSARELLPQFESPTDAEIQRVRDGLRRHLMQINAREKSRAAAAERALAPLVSALRQEDSSNDS